MDDNPYMTPFLRPAADGGYQKSPTPAAARLILLVKGCSHIMKTAPQVEGNDFVFYDLYQSLPVGAAFVDTDRKVFAANRKMRAYFPTLSGGQEGLPVCGAVRCPQFRNGADPYGPRCKDCVLSRALIRILCENRPMAQAKWKHVRPRRGGAPCQGGTPLVRWFSVGGNPVSFFGRRYAVLFFHDVTLQMLREKILRQKLKLDRQTSILNKVSLLHALDALLRTKGRESYTVCMIDFDDFKSVNDRYGHLMGDRVLETFCRIARRDVRGGDILGRFGGEEFLFVLKADREQAVSILRRIQFDLRKSFFGVLAPPVTFSAGVASCGGKPRGWEALVKEADGLLYRAKADGKNQIVSAGRLNQELGISLDTV